MVVSSAPIIDGFATDTIVVSTRIMKKPSTSVHRAAQGLIGGPETGWSAAGLLTPQAYDLGATSSLSSLRAHGRPATTPRTGTFDSMKSSALSAPPRASLWAPIGAGIVCSLVGFTAAFAVVLAGLQAVGASSLQAASG